MEPLDTCKPCLRGREGVFQGGQALPEILPDAATIRWQLALCGLASLGVYAAGITARYPLMAGLQKPRGTWVTIVGATWEALVVHLGVYVLLTLLYVLALQTARTGSVTGRRRRIVLILAIWLGCSGVLLGAYPGGESHDVFDYLFRGRMIVAYGANPLAEAPSRFANAPFYHYISWHSHVDTYGPLWEYASAAVTALVRHAFSAVGMPAGELSNCPQASASCSLLATSVLGYRLLAIGLAGLSGALIAIIVGRAQPAQAPAALLAWLWNPVLLISTALGAHNDVVMLALLLAALALIQRQRLIPGMVMLGLAVHIKLTALLIVPILGIWMVRQSGWRVAVQSMVRTLAIVVPLSWLLYAPLGGWATLPQMLYERGLFLANSPATILYRWLLDVQQIPQHQARAIATQSATLLFGAPALVLLARVWRADRSTDADTPLWHAVAILTLAYLLIGSFWFQHWYLLWVLAPAALLPHSRLTRVVVPWYGFGALAANLAGNMLAELPDLALSRLVRESITVGITLAPMGIALLFNAGQARLNRRRSRIKDDALMQLHK